MSPSFPITPLLPEIQRSLAAHSRLVLEAPPGAGKTTQVPLALLDEAWLAGRKIVVPVSYTHLDVYKRQVHHCEGRDDR